MVGEGHAPVVALLCREGSCSRRKKKADESIPDTKGRESRTPTDFPLHNSRFWRGVSSAVLANLMGHTSGEPNG
jgi:hypothetical protein